MSRDNLCLALLRQLADGVIQDAFAGMLPVLQCDLLERLLAEAEVPNALPDGCVQVGCEDAGLFLVLQVPFPMSAS